MDLYQLGRKETLFFLPCIPLIMAYDHLPITIPTLLERIDNYVRDGCTHVAVHNHGPWQELIGLIQPFILESIGIYPHLSRYCRDINLFSQLVARNWRCFQYINDSDITDHLIETAIHQGQHEFLQTLSSRDRRVIANRFPQLMYMYIRFDPTFLFGRTHEYSDAQLCEFIRINPRCIEQIPIERRHSEMINETSRSLGIEFYPGTHLIRRGRSQQPQQQQSLDLLPLPLNIHRLPKHVEDAVIEQAFTKEPPICPITMEPLTRDTVVVTVCGHLFSRGALEEALLSLRSVCPTCRGPL